MDSPSLLGEFILLLEVLLLCVVDTLTPFSLYFQKFNLDFRWNNTNSYECIFPKLAAAFLLKDLFYN